MTLAPIIVFGYNRPDHYQQTLDALRQNRLAEQSILFLYCDGPKTNATDDILNKISEVRKIAKDQHWAKETFVIESEQNKGLADSIIGGVTEIVNKYGRVIVLEDDMITSPGFLQYMNDALELYKDEERVMHITGYMFPVQKELPDTFFYEVPFCWSWATWSRAWKNFSNNIDELYNYWKNDWGTFNKWGWHDLQEQLESNYNGTLYTWYIKWHAVLLRMNALTLYPGKSLVTNIGLDGSGENCSIWRKFDITEMPDSITVNRIKIEENKRIAKIIRIWQSGHWYSRRYREQWKADTKKILTSLLNKIVKN